MRTRVITWLAAIVLSAPLPTQAGVVNVSVADLGYPSGDIEYGPNPHFEVHVPIYAGAHNVRVAIRASVAPVVDAQSTVVLSVDGNPEQTMTIGRLRVLREIDATIPLNAASSARSAVVALDAYMTSGGSTCASSDARSMWISIDPGSTIRVDEDDSAPTLASFFEDYGGRFAFSVESNAKPSTRDLGITVPYWLHQMQRWRSVRIEEAPAKDAGRTLVLGDYQTALHVVGKTLYASPLGLELLAAHANELVLAQSAQSRSVTHYPQDFHYLSFENLVAGARTVDDAGLYELPVPFTLAQIGGMPNSLQLTLDTTHSSFPSDDRANVDVMLNGYLVNSFTLDANLRNETFDAPLDGRFLRARNNLKVSVEYLPGVTTCRTGHPDLHFTFLPDSGLSWRAVQRTAPSVSDFFNSAAGRVIVLLQDQHARIAAMALLDRLGSLNGNVTQIEVRQYTGTIPDGYDYAIVVGAAYHPQDFASHVDPQRNEFALRTPQTRVVFAAKVNASYGVLETMDSNSTPALLLTYVGKPDVMNQLANVPADELAADAADVLVFNEDGIRFTSHDYITALHENSSSARLGMLPTIPLFGLAMLVALTWISLRARRAS